MPALTVGHVEDTVRFMSWSDHHALACAEARALHTGQVAAPGRGAAGMQSRARSRPSLACLRWRLRELAH
jgi:hypothetical protein